MTVKILLISRNAVSGKSEQDILNLPLFAQKKLADEELSLGEYLNRVNNKALDSKYLSVSYEDRVDEEHISLGEDDFHDVIINEHLLVHLKRADVGYIVDCYKHFDDSEDDELEHDYDNDYITSVTVWDDDLEDDED